MGPQGFEILDHHGKRCGRCQYLIKLEVRTEYSKWIFFSLEFFLTVIFLSNLYSISTLVVPSFCSFSQCSQDIHAKIEEFFKAQKEKFLRNLFQLLLCHLRGVKVNHLLYWVKSGCPPFPKGVETGKFCPN